MNTKPRIAVLCGGNFAFPSIQILALENYLVAVGVGSGEKQFNELLKTETLNAGIEFKEFSDSKSVSQLDEWLTEVSADLVFSICFPFRIPQSVIERLTGKCINFHSGPLPAYRGPMPIFEVLRNGETETAVSVHLMNERFDEGPILLLETVPIANNETFGSLAQKLSERTSMVTLNVAQMLEFGTANLFQAQSAENSGYYDKPLASDTRIKWNSMQAVEIIALINSCNPWNNGAQTSLNGRELNILSALVIDSSHAAVPGTILGIDSTNGLRVACIDDQQLEILIVKDESGFRKGSELFTYSRSETRFLE